MLKGENYNSYYLFLQNCLYSLKHTLLLDKVEVFLHELCQSWNSLVQILVPDVVEAEHTFCNLLSVAGSPEFLELVDDLLVVVRLDRSTVLAYAALVVCDDGSQTEYESLWEFALALEIYLYSWQVACLILRE